MRVFHGAQAAFQQHLLAHQQQQGAKQAAAKHAQQALAGAPSKQAVGNAGIGAEQVLVEDVTSETAQNPQMFAHPGAQPVSASAMAAAGTMQPRQSRVVGSPDVPQQRATSVPPHQQHVPPLLQSVSLPSITQQQQQQQQAMQMQAAMRARQAQARAMLQQQQAMSQHLQQQPRQTFEAGNKREAGGQQPAVPQVSLHL